MHRAYHGFVLLGTAHRQDARVLVPDARFLVAHAAGDDDLAIFGHGLADRVEGFLLGAIQKTTGVDHDNIGVVVGRRNLVAVEFQLGENAFGIHQGLGAPEGDEADFACGHTRIVNVEKRRIVQDCRRRHSLPERDLRLSSRRRHDCARGRPRALRTRDRPTCRCESPRAPTGNATWDRRPRRPPLPLRPG